MSLYRIMPKIPKYRVGLTSNMDRVYKQLGHEHKRINQMVRCWNEDQKDRREWSRNMNSFIIKVISNELEKVKKDRSDG